MELNPQEVIELKELRLLSWRAVWTMPEHLRRVITHLYICDRTPEEAARMLGVTRDTLHQLHEKALANLRARIN